MISSSGNLPVDDGFNDEENKRKRRILIQILLIIAFAIVLALTNDENSYTNKQEEFPKPDPSKGQSLGYSFERGEYRYATEYDGSTSISTPKSYGNKCECTEDEARDILDYKGD